MKTLMKLGYVSVEVIVVAAIVIIGGLAGVSAFLKNGQNAQKTASENMNTALNEAQKFQD